MGATMPWQQWATLGGIVLGAIALLYLLRPRRRQVQVPFGGLWQEVLAKADARSLGQRWRRLLSWLLMSLIASLLLSAIGLDHLGLQGCSEPPKVTPRHTAVIVDASASMKTQDGAAHIGGQRSRLSEAKERALAVIAAARPGEQMLIMRASGRLTTLCGWTTDKTILRKAVSAIEATDGGFDLQRALHAASDAVMGRAHAQTLVVTDGGPPTRDVSSRADVSFVMVGPLRDSERKHGTGIDNLAVERVSVRAQPGDAARGVLMVKVRNDRAGPVTCRVEIAADSDAKTAAEFQQKVRAVRTLVVPAAGHAWLRVSDLDLSVGRFAARVRPPEDAAWRDVASWDDWGFSVLSERKRLAVLLVTKGNLFLEAALIANDRFVVKRIAADAYDPKAKWPGIDVVVLDQVPDGLPIGLPGLRLQLAPPPGATAGSLHEAGDLVVRDHGHPVMRGVTFHDANLDKVRPLPTLAGDVVLAGERKGAAVLIAREDEVRSLEFGIDLMETDLGARYALPVFMGNAVDWLAGEEDGLLSALVMGRPFSVQAPARSADWRWSAPGAKPVPARMSDSHLVGTTEVQGIHQWHRPQGQHVARPTRLPKTEKPGLGRAPKARWRQPILPKSPEKTRLPIWIWLLLGGLGLLLVEWLLYHRRRTV
ncbi:MAG: VWA domain-containing protein [Myxococcales bacterium]|nr:VWA domain-containing protein [Myxococcales bacterium]